MKGLFWYVALVLSSIALRYFGEAATLAQFGPLVQAHVATAPLSAADVVVVLLYFTAIVGLVMVGLKQRLGVLVTRLGQAALCINHGWNALGIWSLSEMASASNAAETSAGRFLQSIAYTPQQAENAAIVMGFTFVLQPPLYLWSYLQGSKLLLRMYDHGWKVAPQSATTRTVDSGQSRTSDWDVPPARPRSAAQQAQLAIAQARAAAAPTDAPTQAELARILEDVDNPREAEVQWHKVLLLDPKNAEAAVALHRVALPADRPAARDRLASMTALYPNDPVLSGWHAEQAARDAARVREEAQARERALQREAQELAAAEAAQRRDQQAAAERARRRQAWLIGSGVALSAGAAVAAWLVEDAARQEREAENRRALEEAGLGVQPTPPVEQADPGAAPRPSAPAADQPGVVAPADKFALRIPTGTGAVVVYPGMAEADLRRQVSLESVSDQPDGFEPPANATVMQWSLDAPEQNEGQAAYVALVDGQVQQIFVPSIDGSGMTEVQSGLVKQIERVAGPANGESKAFWRVPGGTAARICSSGEDHVYCYVLLRG